MISSSSSADSAHSSSSRETVAQSAARSPSSHRFRRIHAYETDSPRSSASSKKRVRVVCARSRSPRQTSRRAATGSGESISWTAPGEAARKRSQTSSIGRPRRRVRPAQRAQGEPLDPRPGAGRERLLRPRLDLAHALDALGGRAERHRRQGVRARRRVRAGLGQRVLEVRPALVVGRDRAPVRQQQPRADPRAARRQRRELGRQQLAHPPPLAGRLELVGEREQALGALGPVGRREPQRLLGELDRLCRGPARGRAAGGRGDRVRQPGVRIAGREGQVARPELLAGDRAREREVELPPLPRPRVLAGRRAEERMGGADPARLRAQQPGVYGVLDRVSAADRRELVRAQVAAQRDGEQGPALRVRQRRHAGAEHVLDRVRQRELLADLRQAALDQRAPDLQGEQGVAQRRVGDAAHERPRHAEPEPLRQQATRRVEIERADLDALASEHALERRPAAGPPGQEERDPLLGEPRPGEGQRLGGGRVEPLQVVDRHQQRARQPAQLVEHPERDRLALRRPVGRRRSQQRHLEGGPLRPRQAGELDAVEEVDQARERVARLGAARPRRHHTHPERARRVDPRLPQRGLADPGHAREHQRPPRRAEELPEPRELRLACHQRAEHQRSFAVRDHRMREGRPPAAPLSVPSVDPQTNSVPVVHRRDSRRRRFGRTDRRRRGCVNSPADECTAVRRS